MRKIVHFSLILSLSTLCITLETPAFSMDSNPTTTAHLQPRLTTAERDLVSRYMTERLTELILTRDPKAPAPETTPIPFDALPALVKGAVDHFNTLLKVANEDSIREAALTNPFFATLVANMSCNQTFSYDLSTQSPVFYSLTGRLQTLLAIAEHYPYLTHVGDVLADFYQRAYEGVDAATDIQIAEGAPDFKASKVKDNIIIALRELKNRENKACAHAYVDVLTARIKALKDGVDQHFQTLEQLNTHEQEIQQELENLQKLASEGEITKDQSAEATQQLETALQQIAERKLQAAENRRKVSDHLDRLRAQLFDGAIRNSAQQEAIIKTGIEIPSVDGWDPYLLALSKLRQTPEERLDAVFGELTDSPEHIKARAMFIIEKLLRGDFSESTFEQRAQILRQQIGTLGQTPFSINFFMDIMFAVESARIQTYEILEDIIEARESGSLKRIDPDSPQFRLATLFGDLDENNMRKSLMRLIDFAAQGHQEAGAFLLNFIRARTSVDAPDEIEHVNHTSQMLSIARTFRMMFERGLLATPASIANPSATPAESSA